MIEILIQKTKNKPTERILKHQEFISPLSKKERIKVLNKNNPKQSSVLILLHPINDQLHFTLIQRTTYKGAHSGQISLPGGKSEETDKSHLHTALRECKEEIGVDIKESEVIGELENIYVPPSNFLIHPFLAFSNRNLVFKKEDREVSEIIHLPIKKLVRQNIKEGYVPLNPKIKCYLIENKVIWGATATILAELEMILMSN